MILAILKMIGCLALLLFGMKTMSEGLQKLTGGHLRAVLGTMTKHRVGVHYMDIINDCEKLGDYIVNVVEAHLNHRLKK